MMETNKKHTENALKQALRRRQPGRLPSNFNYRMKEYLSGMDFSHADSSLLAFYSYIATLVLLLLGLDYWLRKKKFHS